MKSNHVLKSVITALVVGVLAGACGVKGRNQPQVRIDDGKKPPGVGDKAITEALNGVLIGRSEEDVKAGVELAKKISDYSLNNVTIPDSHNKEIVVKFKLESTAVEAHGAIDSKELKRLATNENSPVIVSAKCFESTKDNQCFKFVVQIQDSKNDKIKTAIATVKSTATAKYVPSPEDKPGKDKMEAFRSKLSENARVTVHQFADRNNEEVFKAILYGQNSAESKFRVSASGSRSSVTKEKPAISIKSSVSTDPAQEIAGLTDVNLTYTEQANVITLSIAFDQASLVVILTAKDGAADEDIKIETPKKEEPKKEEKPTAGGGSQPGKGTTPSSIADLTKNVETAKTQLSEAKQKEDAAKNKVKEISTALEAAKKKATELRAEATAVEGAGDEENTFEATSKATEAETTAANLESDLKKAQDAVSPTSQVSQAVIEAQKAYDAAVAALEAAKKSGEQK